MSPVGTWKKVQEFSADHHSPTYIISSVTLKNAGVDLDCCIICIDCSAVAPTHIIAASVALECAVMNLHIGTIESSNSAPLEVACPPPGN
jgi:hypothetical protein